MSHEGNDKIIDDLIDVADEWQSHYDECGGCPKCELAHEWFADITLTMAIIRNILLA